MDEFVYGALFGALAITVIAVVVFLFTGVLIVGC